MRIAPRIELIWELAKRDLTDRYAGNGLGFAWFIIQPAAMVAIYLSVFTLIFKTRMPDIENVTGSYALFFLSGFVCWIAQSEMLSRAPTLVTFNAALVKQIVFPTEVLPIKSALAVSLTQLFFLLIVIAFSFLSFGPNAMVVGLLVACPLLFLFNMGFASLLSALGVFVNDVKDFVGLILTGGLFLTPVFYPPGSVKGALATVIAFNPLSYPIYCFQDVLYYQRIEHPEAWIIFAVMSVTLAVVGQWFYRSTKHLFGDVL